MRRTTLTTRGNVGGCRAVGIRVAQAMGLCRHAADPAEQGEARGPVALMMPVAKASCADPGPGTASYAIQRHGGHRCIRDPGVGQCARDARIAMLRDGANGIRAPGLAGRRMPSGMGRPPAVLHPVSDRLDNKRCHAGVGAPVAQPERAFGMLQCSTASIGQRGRRDPEEAGAAVTDCLRLVGGGLSTGYMRARSSAITAHRIGESADGTGVNHDRSHTARCVLGRILPRTGSPTLATRSGEASTLAMPEAAF